MRKSPEFGDESNLASHKNAPRPPQAIAADIAMASGLGMRLGKAEKQFALHGSTRHTDHRARNKLDLIPRFMFDKIDTHYGNMPSSPSASARLYTPKPAATNQTNLSASLPRTPSPPKMSLPAQRSLSPERSSLLAEASQFSAIGSPISPNASWLYQLPDSPSVRSMAGDLAPHRLPPSDPSEPDELAIEMARRMRETYYGPSYQSKSVEVHSFQQDIQQSPSSDDAAVARMLNNSDNTGGHEASGELSQAGADAGSIGTASEDTSKTPRSALKLDVFDTHFNVFALMHAALEM